MVKTSIVALLLARGVSLDASLNILADFILANDPPDGAFVRRRMEVVARQRNDAWDAFWTASDKTGITREDLFRQDDSHVLDYVIERLS